MQQALRVGATFLLAGVMAACANKNGGDADKSSAGDKTAETAKKAEAAAKPASGAPAQAKKPMEAAAPAAGDIPAPDDVAAAPDDAKKTKGGVAYKVLQAGDGDAKPDPWDIVKVHYTGWTTDGKMFDSSVKRGKPIDFPLNRVIPGWTEGVGEMTKGAKHRLWIPQEMAYKGRPGAPQGMLVFDVELLEIKDQPEPPPPPETPKDVAAAPKDAKKTKSGIAYKMLKKGDGKTKPTAASTVKVHYSGWTTDGKMFDSSVTRGQPASFPLRGVIAGWTEGVQLMSVGAKYRFWIPENLAYKGQRPPFGTLVFDIELLEVK